MSDIWSKNDANSSSDIWMQAFHNFCADWVWPEHVCGNGGRTPSIGILAPLSRGPQILYWTQLTWPNSCIPLLPFVLQRHLPSQYWFYPPDIAGCHKLLQRTLLVNRIFCNQFLLWFDFASMTLSMDHGCRTIKSHLFAIAIAPGLKILWYTLSRKEWSAYPARQNRCRLAKEAPMKYKCGVIYSSSQRQGCKKAFAAFVRSLTLSFPVLLIQLPLETVHHCTGGWLMVPCQKETMLQSFASIKGTTYLCPFILHWPICFGVDTLCDCRSSSLSRVNGWWCTSE